ncbi:hypothetical protein M1555_04450 [Patescibacteria group bacterium]|nr:hypothetical protein [Patescibacteria group bacterium]
MSLVEAETLIQKAMDISFRSTEGELKLPEELLHAGVMNVHYAYYNSALFAHPDMQTELQEHPNGALAQLVKALRDARLADDDYSRDTLNEMYGLSD